MWKNLALISATLLFLSQTRAVRDSQIEIERKRRTRSIDDISFVIVINFLLFFLIFTIEPAYARHYVGVLWCSSAANRDMYYAL